MDKSAFSDEDKVMNAALEAGAEDIKSDDPERFEVITVPAEVEKVKAALVAAGIPVASAEATMLPGTTVSLEGSDGRKMLSLLEDLEDNDDVKDVYANCDIKE